MLLGSYFKIENTEVEGSGHRFDIALNRDHKIYGGHFPGNPVCPGVCSVQMIRECAERAAGCRLRIGSLQSCRFMAVLTPDNASRLTIVVTLADVQDDRVRLTAEIRNGADVCVALKGEFGKH